MADFKAISPEASVFAPGQGEQTYMGALAGDLNNPMRRFELIRRMNQGGSGQQAYLQALSEAQRTQLQGAERENSAKLSTAYMSNAANMANAGISSAVLPADTSYLRLNEGQLQQADLIAANKGLSGNFDTVTQGIERLGKVGYLPSAEVVGQMITGPFEEQAIQVQPYMTPGDTSQRMTAEASQTNAAANMMDARNPKKYSNSGGSDKNKVTVDFVGDRPGRRSYEFTGPNAVANSNTFIKPFTPYTAAEQLVIDQLIREGKLDPGTLDRGYGEGGGRPR